MVEGEERRLEALIEEAPDAVVLVDPERRIVLFNAMAEALYGWPREEVIGRHIDVLVPERFRGLLASLDTATIRDGGRLGAGLELFALQRGGGEVPVEINMSTLESEGGLQVVSHVRDVTRRREIEARLAASEAKFRRVVEGLEGEYFFATIAADGSVTYVSPSVEAVLGYGREEVHADFRGYLTDAPCNARALEIFEAELRGERFPTYDLEARAKDGSVRRLECFDTPVLDEAGRVVAIESINRDVTELRRLEAEARAAGERIEGLLRTILPGPLVDEFRENDRVRPRRHRDVAVLFCDLAGFTAWSEAREPEEVVRGLGQVVLAFEAVAEAHGLQKIKTIGDSFMAAAGLLRPSEDPVGDAVRCGLAMTRAAEGCEPPWQTRIGIHLGDVVAGVMGERQFGYDLWGDTVNTASRLERHAVHGELALSSEAFARVAERCTARSLGRVPVKGKGELEIFRVRGLR